MKGGYTSSYRCYNKVCGLKPTYGKISKYSLMRYVSLMHCVELVAQNLEVIQVVLNTISGNDYNDEGSTGFMIVKCKLVRM